MTPGSLYRVGGQTFLDSQAIYNLAREHEVVATAGGWRVFVTGGAIECSLVDDHAPLPQQQGGLYAVRVQGRPTAIEWFSRGIVRSAGTYPAWPDAPKPCGTCGPACGCAPCRHRHHPDTE